MSESTSLSNRMNNFLELEEKLKGVISMCGKSTLVDVINAESEHFGIHNIKNATKCECYQLNNGLYVYEFKADKQSICFQISSSPLYEKYTYGSGGRSGNDYVGYRNLGGAFFEYSCGGIGNSTPLDNCNKYPMVKHVGVLGDDGDNCFQTQLVFSETAPVEVGSLSIFNRFKYRNFYENGDLRGLISAYEPDSDIKRKLVEKLKQTLTKIDGLILEKGNSEKKSFLKRLLINNAILDKTLDAFAKGGRKRQ